MSSYFDNLTRRVADGPADPEREYRDKDAETAFIEHVRAIEAEAFATITRLTGDREFPDDLRQRILGIFAVRSIYQPGSVPVPEEAESWVREIRYSRCLEELHDAFHDVARRRVKTRFGLLSDHPEFDLARRDEHDQEGA